MSAAGLPRLHLVTSAEVVEGPDFVQRAGRVLEALGSDVALHLRAPGIGVRRVLEAARALSEEARAAGAALIVNDRVDVALALGGVGVQLGARSLPPAAARELLGAGALIGASVHSPGEASRAQEEGADFVVMGTVYPTPSHPGWTGCGPEGVREAAAAVGVPVIAIGGVTVERVAELLGAGAHGVAALSGVWHAERPEHAAARYVAALKEASKEARDE